MAYKKPGTAWQVIFHRLGIRNEVDPFGPMWCNYQDAGRPFLACLALAALDAAHANCSPTASNNRAATAREPVAWCFQDR